MDTIPAPHPIVTMSEEIFDYSEMAFNMDSGYFEGLIRGFRGGLLTRTDYINLCQCETLDGMSVKYALYPRVDLT
jgi:hypothetical protein